MKCLVLKRRSPAYGDDDIFLEAVGAGTDSDGGELPFTAETHDLNEAERLDVQRDPDVEDVVLSIPFTLIEPVGEASAEAANKAWGIEAVGAASNPLKGDNVTVAVLDTGIDTTHKAFEGVTFDLMDFTTDEEGTPGVAPDTHGHGTHVAGTIFGRNVDGVRIGVAPGVKKVLIGKVLGGNGGSTEAVYNGLQWALRKRADIISMSLGMNYVKAVAQFANELPDDIAFSKALEAYRANVRLFERLSALVQERVIRGRGALLVAATGNDSRRKEDPRFTVAVAPPAAADGFTSVGALAQTPLGVASFSNTGCLLSAPGTRILSAKLGGGLKLLDGTSMATPHVAGVAALWIQKLFPNGERPGSWARDVQRALESNVKPLPGGLRKDVGLGMVQAPQ